ncbi:TetR/AcrR family transcriptional regulator [Paenibacillus sp. LHD-117]|uniref:TetR/AcrR family transcriptional regulator n=1 Tax=Paenibacillus sp. LHD-117 TaxID=3071412 RepID=UPI0027DFF2B5|nr:TetR/AcrR family transcriptional regulator [Paenibacillus sp. LHD-117]MDQ6422818.1 TetR/AcrR family transcriptional regulator [Paenibacillus sp. LHD-117]
MGTKVRNLRTTLTKQSLINAFVNLVNEKDFDKITIADLTRGANVNRATFYAHFNDKYELLDYIVDESASNIIAKHTAEVEKFEDIIYQLVLAVCEFNQQPNIQCRRSYLNLIPQLKDKMLIELKKYLSNILVYKFTDIEMSFYVPIYANIILEAGYLWASGQVSFDKETIAKKVSLFELR